MDMVKQSRNWFGLFSDTFSRWLDREPFRNAAVIAFYTIFSLPGLLVIIINLAGYFYGEEAITRRISSEIEGMIGGSTAKDIEAIIANASMHGDSTFASIVGIATLIFGATGVFYQLQQTLNQIWEVKPDPGQKTKIIKMVVDRIFSFGLILVVGFLLLVSLVLSAMLTVLSNWVAVYFSETFNLLFRLLDVSLSLCVITFLFASIYKVLPDADIPWRDVWVGALVTSLLFVLAKYALGLYFGYSNPASAYGAAGTIILIMLWVSYAGLIILFGAEFTRVYANRHGGKIKPSEFAVSTSGSIDNYHHSQASSLAEAERANQVPPVYPLKKDLTLGHQETVAASPVDMSVSGEEDPGVALEFLVTSNKPKGN